MVITSLLSLVFATTTSILVAAAPIHEFEKRLSWSYEDKKKKKGKTLNKRDTIILCAVIGAIFAVLGIHRMIGAQKAWKKRRDDRRKWLFRPSPSTHQDQPTTTTTPTLHNQENQKKKPKINWAGWKASSGKKAHVSKAHEPVPVPAPDPVPGMEDQQVAEVGEQPWSKVPAESGNYPASKVMVTMPSPAYGGWDRHPEKAGSL